MVGNVFIVVVVHIYLQKEFPIHSVMFTKMIGAGCGGTHL
jgi:hypothetical protein